MKEYVTKNLFSRYLKQIFSDLFSWIPLYKVLKLRNLDYIDPINMRANRLNIYITYIAQFLIRITIDRLFASSAPSTGGRPSVNWSLQFDTNPAPPWRVEQILRNNSDNCLKDREIFTNLLDFSTGLVCLLKWRCVRTRNFPIVQFFNKSSM